jgi:hypothetical protein
MHSSPYPDSPEFRARKPLSHVRMRLHLILMLSSELRMVQESLKPAQVCDGMTWYVQFRGEPLTRSSSIQAQRLPSKQPAVCSMTAGTFTALGQGRSPIQSVETRLPVSMPLGREKKLMVAIEAETMGQTFSLERQPNGSKGGAVRPYGCSKPRPIPLSVINGRIRQTKGSSERGWLSWACIR